MNTIQQYFSKIENPNLRKFLINNKDMFWVFGRPTSSQVQLKYDAEENKKFHRLALKYNLYFTQDNDYKLKTTIPTNSKLKITLIGSKGNKKALGKTYIDEIELAIIEALKLKEDVKNPNELKSNFLIKNNEVFINWKNTFNQTRKAIKEIVGNLKDFLIIHKGTDNSVFSKILFELVRKSSPIISSRDSWCPADIFIIRKSRFDKIVQVLRQFIKDYDSPEGLLINLNSYFYSLYLSKDLYPISLKQIQKEYHIEYENKPGKMIPTYQFELDEYYCDISPENTKDIGYLKFKNIITNKFGNMQVRGFPHNYTVVQTEINSDGTFTNGKIGKVPTKTIDRILKKYNFERIKSIEYFGKEKNGYFSNWTDEKTNEVWRQYQVCVKHSKSSSITKEKFLEYIEKAKENTEIATNMCIKIQGLRILYFLIENQKNIPDILSEMVNGAKKISPSSAFYIRIY